MTRPADVTAQTAPNVTLQRFGLQLKIGFGVMLALCLAMLVMTS